MINFIENIDELLIVNSAISDYCVKFTENHLVKDEALRKVQIEFMLPMFKSYKTDSEKYHSEGKLKKLQKIFKTIEQDASEDVLLEEYVLKNTGIQLGMKDRYFKRFDKILERGKLKTNREYYFIMDQINVLCQLEVKNDEMIEKLNHFVLKYENK